MRTARSRSFSRGRRLVRLDQGEYAEPDPFGVQRREEHASPPVGQPGADEFAADADPREQCRVQRRELAAADPGLAGFHDHAGVLLVAFQDDDGGAGAEGLAEQVEERRQQVVGDEPAGEHLGQLQQLAAAFPLLGFLDLRPESHHHRHRGEQCERRQGRGVHQDDDRDRAQPDRRRQP